MSSSVARTPPQHDNCSHMAAFGHPSRQTSVPATPRQLPNGPCYWKDLNARNGGVKCGCRQFWLNDAGLVAGAEIVSPISSGAWCFCGHHGCFHSILPTPDVVPNVEVVREDRHSRAWTEEDIHGDNRPQPQFTSTHQPIALQQITENSTAADGLGLSLNRGPQLKPGSPRIEQLNPQHLFADFLPSTQASYGQRSENASRAGDIARQSPRSMFKSYLPANSDPPLPKIDVHGLDGFPHPDDRAHSATEIATPSNAGTPALRESDNAFQNLRATLQAFNQQHDRHHGAEPNAPHETVSTAPLQDPVANVASEPARHAATMSNSQTLAMLSNQVAALKALLPDTPHLNASLQNLSARIEALETASFCYVPPDELQDKFENIDGRVLDVEAKIDDLEKLHEAILRKTKSGHNLDFSQHQQDSHNNDSVESDRMDGLAVHARMDSMDSALALHHDRLVKLEAAALPTPSNPWQVEVVFLPFGIDLKGLWGQPAAGSSSLLVMQDNETPATPTQSLRAEAVDSVMDWTASNTDMIVPRACGPSQGIAGLMYERLRSRGFVRTISMNGNSARHVASSIISSLEDVLPGPTIIKHSKTTPLGLQVPFIPLRKIHRSSTLRFLTAAELATPTLWTAEFLNASVFMHAPSTGLRRLFITEPAAYLQHLDEVQQRWTWSKIRQLPRFKDDRTTPVGEADALEQCWAVDTRLDPPVSVNASFSSGLSYHSSFDSHMLSPQRTNPPSKSSGLAVSDSDMDLASDQPSESEFAEEQSQDSDEERMSNPKSPISPISAFRPGSQRTDVGRSSPHPSARVATPKRQTPVDLGPPRNVSKRRRFSRSPDEVELMGLWDLTPRRSREPPSPRGGHAGASMSRRASVMAYATPYSAEFGGRWLGEGGSGGEHMEESEEHGSDDLDENDDDDDDDDTEDEEEHDETHSDGDASMSDVSIEFAGSDSAEDHDAHGDDEAWEGVDEEELRAGHVGGAARHDTSGMRSRSRDGQTHDDGDDRDADELGD